MSSGRLIAVGRLLLAMLFLLAIWFDATQPARAASETYALLIVYAVFALVVLAATWRSWWLDAHLAGPAHAVDILLFTLLVVSTAGYTSPFFVFFVFLLLAAAIRWSWHATALTGMLLILLYLGAGGLVLRSGTEFELQHFVIRTGHLVSISLILLWFGANRWRARLYRRQDAVFGPPSLDTSPIESGLAAVMESVRASDGIFVWRDASAGEFGGVAIHGTESRPVAIPARELAQAIDTSPFLYDIRRDRALRQDRERNLVGRAASDLIGRKAAASLRLTAGLAIPVRSENGEGVMFLERVRGLSTDHLELAEQIAGDVAAHIQRHALLRATDENAEARSRLSLARDLHDSVVQFLAGAAFRLEAMKRSPDASRELGADLDELKQLMLHEQGELRVFITALRSGSQVAFDELAQDLKALADRLSRQWNVNCELAVERADMTIPTRLQIDSHQLMREAVANAARHADARNVRVRLEATPDSLVLTIVNDGAGLPDGGDRRPQMPASLQERVIEAGGEIDIARGMNVTRLSIVLPVGAARR